MKNRKKLLLKLATAITLTVTSIYLFAPWEFALYYFKPLPDTVQKQVDEATRQGLDGIIVYVQKPGQSPELYASGWHNRDKKTPAYPQALFKIASIGKLYDAAALTKLVARGSLSLDKTLADYLPDLNGRIAHADQITLRMMVQHRSGIPNYTDHKDFNWAETSPNVLELVLDAPADFKPDSAYGYSNTNYLLLRRIMAKTLGHDLGRYIKDEILAPLALKHTFFSVADVNPDELMSGYYVGYDDDFKALEQGYVATAEDVGLFLRALNDGSLFTDKEQAIYAPLYEFGHTGWVLGYSSRAHYHQDIDTVVIQFVNTTGNDTVMLTGIIYDRIMEILRQRAP